MSQTRCQNCGATVTGRYCSQCGQRVEPHILSLWHFMREAAADITDADSRVWRTLVPLLFKPGFLTREFLDGRRARYLPPVRLYLTASLLCFVLTSLLDAKPGAIRTAPARPAMDPNTCQLVYNFPWKEQVLPRLRAGCLSVTADGGRELIRQFQANLPGALFVSLPVLALFMKAMYWRPRRYYVEHLLFFVHNHSFVFAAVGLLMVLRHFLGGRAGALLTFVTVIYAAWYFFRAMMNVYGQRRWLTTLKFTTLSAAYLAGGLLIMLLTLFYSFVTLSLESGA